MTRLHHRVDGDKTELHGADALNAVGPTAASVNLPSLSMPSPLDDGDKKFMPMPPQRLGKPHSKKNTQLSDSRIHLEPLRPPTAGAANGRASTRLTVSSSSGRVSWDSNVLEAGSTISENLAAFQELDRKLQFYKALAVLKVRETAESEEVLQKTLSSLLLATATALDATAVVLYSITNPGNPSLRVIACSSPSAVGFHTPLDTFALRGLIEHFDEEGSAATGPAATYVACLQNLGTYEVTCDVDSVLGFSTASVLAGVLPDDHGEPRFVVEARSSQEGLAFSKEFMHATLTAVENTVYPFELRQAFERQTQAQRALSEVLVQAVNPAPAVLERQPTIKEIEQMKTARLKIEDPAKVEAEWLHSPDIKKAMAHVTAAAPAISGVALIEFYTDKQSCEMLASHGSGFESNNHGTLCEVLGSKSELFQKLVSSTVGNARVDLSDQADLRAALHLETGEGRALIFLPVPCSRGALPCGLLCLVPSTPGGSPTPLLEIEPAPPLETRLQPFLAALSLTLAAKQRSDDLRTSTRQKRQLLALCRSHFLVETVRDPSSLVALICEIGSAMFHTDHVTLYVSDTIKRELWSLSSLGSVNGIRIPYGSGIAGHVAASKKPLTVNRPYEDPRFDRSFDAKFGFKTESLLTQPVLDRAGETVGVLQAVNFRRFPTASPPVSRYDAEVMAVYMRLVAHALHVNSSLIIFAKVQADYWANRAAQETARQEGAGGVRRYSSRSAGFDNAELAGDAKLDVASVHSLLDLSGFDEAKCVPRNKWSTFAYACWALGRFLTLQRIAKARIQHVAQMRREKSGNSEGDDEDSDENQAEVEQLVYRPRGRSRTSSVVLAGRTHSLITRWHRMTMAVGQDGRGQVEELLRENFDPLSKSIPELENYAFQLFDGLVLIGTFRIQERTLRTFIGELASRYRDVPYHSFYHGFDVALSSYALMRSPEVLTVIKELEALSLLIAALGHDADHPGNDNQFEVDSNSALALCYNDISVLENHHAATTFAVLRMEGCDILRDLSANARVSARTHIVRCILGTDMKHHTKLLSELALVGSVSEFENVPEGRQLMLNMIIHGSDLASVGRPLRVALKWVERVCAEFTQQAARSAELGINVPPHLLNLQDEGTRCRLQMSFIDYLVAPLWTTISALVPAASETLDNLRANRLYFGEQAALLASKAHS